MRGLNVASGSFDRLNLALRERYNRSGAGWITTTVLDGRRVLRVTIMNPRTTCEHLERLLDGLTVVGGELATVLGAGASPAVDDA